MRIVTDRRATSWRPTASNNVVMPSGFASDGLPTSVQLIGPWYGDMDILALGAVIEADRPWIQRRPELP